MSIITTQRFPHVDKFGITEGLDQNHSLHSFITFAAFAAENSGSPHNMAKVYEEGTASGDPTWGTGDYGPVLSYDGAGDYHTFPTRQLVDLDKPFTVAYRILHRTASGSPVSLTIKTGVANKPLELFFSTTLTTYKPFAFGQANSGAANLGPTTDDGVSPAMNLWHDIAFSYNGSGSAGITTPGNWQLWWNQKNETVINTDAFGGVTDQTSLGAQPTGGNAADCDIDYLVVLDGIEAPELLQRPEQVLRLIESQSRVVFLPVAAAGGGRIMSSLANHGGLAGYGGIAGDGGGLAA